MGTHTYALIMPQTEIATLHTTITLCHEMKGKNGELNAEALEIHVILWQKLEAVVILLLSHGSPWSATFYNYVMISWAQMEHYQAHRVKGMAIPESHWSSYSVFNVWNFSDSDMWTVTDVCTCIWRCIMYDCLQNKDGLVDGWLMMLQSMWVIQLLQGMCQQMPNLGAKIGIGASHRPAAV